MCDRPVSGCRWILQRRWMPSQINQASLAPAITAQKRAAFPALMLILPVSLSLSHPLLVSVGYEKWYQEQRHQPLTVSLHCLDLGNEKLGVNVSCQGLCWERVFDCFHVSSGSTLEKLHMLTCQNKTME